MRLFTRAPPLIVAALALANCAAAPEATKPSDTPAPQTEISRSASPDVACLAEAVYFEARGTSQKGQAAVAHVVVNRANDPEFPGTICGVVADRCQFSYRCDGRPDVLAHDDDRSLAYRTAQAVLKGAPDITDGALFFHASRVAPGWFDTRPRIGEIGGNVFYR